MSQLAQAQDQRRIFSDFQKLELYIKRVGELVQRFNDSAANNYINQARDELEMARKNLFDIKPARYAQALIQMGRARRFAELAAKLVLRKPFANLKSQLDDLLNRAERSVSNVNSDEAYYLLNQAKKFRRRAYDSFLSNELAKGQEYYRIAFFFGRKCIDYLSNKGRNINDQINDLEISIKATNGSITKEEFENRLIEALRQIGLE